MCLKKCTQLFVWRCVRVVVCVYRSVVNVSVMVCTQLVVSGDVCV